MIHVWCSPCHDVVLLQESSHQTVVAASTLTTAPASWHSAHWRLWAPPYTPVSTLTRTSHPQTESQTWGLLGLRVVWRRDTGWCLPGQHQEETGTMGKVWANKNSKLCHLWPHYIFFSIKIPSFLLPIFVSWCISRCWDSIQLCEVTHSWTLWVNTDLWCYTGECMGHWYPLCSQGRGWGR